MDLVASIASGRRRIISPRRSRRPKVYSSHHAISEFKPRPVRYAMFLDWSALAPSPIARVGAV
jgi:hypothetical protein